MDKYRVKLKDSRFDFFLSDKGIQGEVKSNCLAIVADATQVFPIDELIARVSSWLNLVQIDAYIKRYEVCLPTRPQELFYLDRLRQQGLMI